jgi:hypothetical protein
MRDGWLYESEVAYERWVAKLVARLLATAALWVQIQTSLKKYKMDNISTLARQKKYTKKSILLPT